MAIIATKQTRFKRKSFILFALGDGQMTIYDILKDTNYKSEQFSAEAIDRLNARIHEKTDKKGKVSAVVSVMSLLENYLPKKCTSSWFSIWIRL